MIQVARPPISQASPRQIRFAGVARSSSGRVETTGSKAAEFMAGASSVLRRVERTESERSVGCVGVRSVASRSVQSRSVAYVRGSSPTSALARALVALKRAARAKVVLSIAERLATLKSRRSVASVASVASSNAPSRAFSGLRSSSPSLVASQSGQSRLVASSPLKRVLQ